MEQTGLGTCVLDRFVFSLKQELSYAPAFLLSAQGIG